MDMRMEPEEFCALMQLIEHAQHPSYPMDSKIAATNVRVTTLEETFAKIHKSLICIIARHKHD